MEGYTGESFTGDNEYDEHQIKRLKQNTKKEKFNARNFSCMCEATDFTKLISIITVFVWDAEHRMESSGVLHTRQLTVQLTWIEWFFYRMGPAMKDRGKEDNNNINKTVVDCYEHYANM